MRPTKKMILAVSRVHPTERHAARLLAEKTFFSSLEKLRRWGDFSETQHQAMASDAAAAEVLFRFA